MVVCIIAFFVFAILSIFSAKYRPLAKEAFKCVFLKLTFRPCDAKLDERIKAGVVGKLMDTHPSLAKFTNKHFEAISFAFTILMVVSMIYLAIGAFNFWKFGTCDPANPQNCPLTIFVANSSNVNDTIVPANCTIVADFAEFYGAECPHCKKMEPIVAQVEAETGVKFEKLEVWHDENNQKTMMIHSNEIQRDCGTLGVPAFVSIKNRKAVCGEMTAEQLKTFVNANK